MELCCLFPVEGGVVSSGDKSPGQTRSGRPNAEPCRMLFNRGRFNEWHRGGKMMLMMMKR
jgi:hypothetical protein